MLLTSDGSDTVAMNNMASHTTSSEQLQKLANDGERGRVVDSARRPFGKR